jgi:hypothetical protein
MFVKDNLAALVGKRAQTKEGITWHAIVDGRKAGMEARVALAM